MNTRDAVSRFQHLRGTLTSLERLVSAVLSEITPYHQNISGISLATDLASLLSEGEQPIHFRVDALREKYLRERPYRRGGRPGRIFA
jgi:hypothetical protein